MKVARKRSDMFKVDFILNLLDPGKNLGVMDPWYHDEEAFEKVYLQLDKVCELISQKLINETNRL